MYPAPYGGGGCQPDQGADNAIQSKRGKGVPAHQEPGGDDLQKGAELTPDAGGESAHAGEGEGHAGGGQNQQVAPEDDGYEPPGYAAMKREEDIDGAAEHFVGDGNQVGAGGGGPCGSPGHASLGHVGEC